MQALIETKADIEPCDVRRRTPLLLASSMDNTLEIVESLLDAVCLEEHQLFDSGLQMPISPLFA